MRFAQVDDLVLVGPMMDCHTISRDPVAGNSDAFQVNVPEEELVELRRRISATLLIAICPPPGAWIRFAEKN